MRELLEEELEQRKQDIEVHSQSLYYQNECKWTRLEELNMHVQWILLVMMEVAWIIIPV